MEDHPFLTLETFHIKEYMDKYKKLYSEYTISLIEHTGQSILNAFECISNIKPEIDNASNDLINYKGFSGVQTRHLYNNIGNLCDKTGLKLNLFEVGTWYGSSTISFLYKNKINDCLFIDNWSQFEGNKDILVDSLEKYKMKDTTYTLIENDCWTVNINNLPRNYYNIYLYDGGHSELDHYKALTYYLQILQKTFIFIVDDLNFPLVRDGTMKAINDLDLKILFRHEIFMSPADLVGMPNHNGKNSFWNGCGIFVLQKE